MMSFPAESLEFLNQGWILEDPTKPILKDPIPDWAERQINPDADPTSPQSEQKSARYQDDVKFRQVLPHAAGAQWYPLAAFVVPRGEIGFIYNVQTQLIGFPGDETFLWYRNQDPIAFLWTVPGIDPTGAPRWRLVLENRDPEQNRAPRRIQQFETGPLPSHPQIGTWFDGRFEPSGGGGYRTKLMIAEGTTARLWCGMPIPELQEQAMPQVMFSRLSGYTQSYTDNTEARFNARRAF